MLAGAGLFPRQAPAKNRGADFDSVDAYVRASMDALDIPGAALVIVEGDQIVHLAAFAAADADGRPATPQTPFFTGSTGKLFTALAILQLVAAGQLVMSAEDFRHYLITQLNGGSYRGASILSPAGISAMHHADALIPVPERDPAVAMLMNTHSPMLGIRVARVPANVLRMLLDQRRPNAHAPPPPAPARRASAPG